MKMENLTNEEIQTAIDQRIAWINRIIQFMEKYVSRLGRETYRHQSSSYTRHKHELLDYEGFSFFSDIGYTAKYRVRWKNKPVLEVHTTGSALSLDALAMKDSANIITGFVSDSEWQNKLDELMTNIDAIIEARQSASAREQESATTAMQQEAERKRLEDIANRLRL